MPVDNQSPIPFQSGRFFIFFPFASFHLLFRDFFRCYTAFSRNSLSWSKNYPRFSRNQKCNTSKKCKIRKTNSRVFAVSGSFISIICDCYICLGQLPFIHFLFVLQWDLPFARERDPKTKQGLENYIYRDLPRLKSFDLSIHGA